MRRPLVVLVALGLLAACSGDDDDSTSVRPETPPDTSTVAPTTAAEPAPTTTTPPPDLDAVSVALEPVADGLDSPVAIAFRAGDNRMYVAEQSGRVRIVAANGTPVEPPVVDIAVSGGNEQGLLGLAFSPDGTRLYVDYTDPGGDTHVDEYTMNGDVAENRRELLFVAQPYGNHNGGQLVVDSAGMLYIALGDGGSGGDPQGNGQNTSTLLGTIVRIDPNGDPYAVPADNPFTGQAGARPEIWMFGLRNPWRFSFDRATGDVWIADVGQNEWEEVDFVPAAEAAGVNWGWNAREGTHEFAGPPPEGARDPITERPLGSDYCALIGGYVYRGAAIASLNGAYLFTDHCRGEIEGLVQEGGAPSAERDLGLRVASPTSFGEDHDGELYVASREGAIYKLVSG